MKQKYMVGSEFKGRLNHHSFFPGNDAEASPMGRFADIKTVTLSADLFQELNNTHDKDHPGHSGRLQEVRSRHEWSIWNIMWWRVN
jgi:hypothetical protein